jgi:hypothetical protein
LELRVHGFSARIDDLQQQMVAGVIATSQGKELFWRARRFIMNQFAIQITPNASPA